MAKRMFDSLGALRALMSGKKPLAVGDGTADDAGVVASTATAVDFGKHGTNPYLDARREWNERYGDYIQQAQQWRLAALISGAIALVSSGGIAYIGAQSKVVPYVVEVDKLGMASAVSPAEHTATADARIIRAYLARFITDWRTVSIDPVAQKGAIDRVYAMLPSGSSSLVKLNEHFTANNPFKIAATDRIAISITDMLKISDQTWQVEWQEVRRNLRGELTSNLRMKASITVGITPPTEERLILINPLGVYITDLNWSRQL